MEIAVAIPTYNRPDDLRLCVRSVVRQSLVPSKVLVVDDGLLSRSLLGELEKELHSAGSRLIYIRKDPSRIGRGTSSSRNLIMHAVDDLVLLIDDDIKLDPDCIKHMAEAWQKMDDGRLLGVGGIIKNNRHAGSAEKIFNKIFLLGSDLSWDVSDSGYQVWDDSIDRLERGHYIHGGFCMYRPDIARKILFPVFQDGRNSLEDVHFALSAKILGYRFAIEPKATAFHAHSKTQRDGSYEAGLKESMNRRLIFRDLCEQGRWRNLKFAWSSFGWVLRQFLSGHFIKGSGMMVGMFTRLPE